MLRSPRIESGRHLQVITSLRISPSSRGRSEGAPRVIGVTEGSSSSRDEIMAQSWIYILVTLLVPFLYLLNFSAYCSVAAYMARHSIRNVSPIRPASLLHDL